MRDAAEGPGATEGVGERARELPEAARAVFDALDREVWIVTSTAGGRRGGLLATFVNQASISPETPRVLVGISTRHHTHTLIDDGGCLALHLVDESAVDLAAHFARTSGRDVDKLEGVSWTPGVTEAPILERAIGWLEARAEAALDVGDRTIWVARVVAASAPSGPPLTARRLFERLSPEDSEAIRADFQRDAIADAEAIRAWRSRRDG